MAAIVNTKLHTKTGLIINPFGKDGSMHFVPIDGEKPGKPFILDADAVKELRAALAR